MTDRATLLALAERVEAARVSDRTGLRNEVALATGWHRVEPRFTKSKHGAWIKPCDFIGVHSDGSPKLDSLHGTDMYREPTNFLESLDAAMSLVPSGWSVGIGHLPGVDWLIRAHLRDHRPQSLTPAGHSHIYVEGHNKDFALALTAASLRAIAGSMTDD